MRRRSRPTPGQLSLPFDFPDSESEPVTETNGAGQQPLGVREEIPAFGESTRPSSADLNAGAPGWRATSTGDLPGRTSTQVPVEDHSLKKTLDWEDVEAAASAALDVWGDGKGLIWSQEAWTFMVEAGLAGYSSPSGQSEAGIIFLALCGLYRDFCNVAWEEEFPRNYTEWAEMLPVAAAAEVDLARQADRARPVVFRTIRRGFGDNWRLFLSLWETHGSPSEAKPAENDWQAPSGESPDEIRFPGGGGNPEYGPGAPVQPGGTRGKKPKGSKGSGGRQVEKKQSQNTGYGDRVEYIEEVETIVEYVSEPGEDPFEADWNTESTSGRVRALQWVEKGCPPLPLSLN